MTVGSGKSKKGRGARRRSFNSRASLVPASGRIGGAGRVEVEEPGVRGIARGVAIAVSVVSGGATRGEFLAARSLRELPDHGVRHAAYGRSRRTVRDDAARRRRARIVEDPIGELALAEIVANVVGGDDGHAVSFVDSHSRAIDSSAITGVRQFIDPRSHVRVILCRETSAFLDIQKNDRV